MFSISKFFLYTAVFFVIIMTPTTLFPYIVGKYVWFRVTVALALIFFLIGLISDKSAHIHIARLRNLFRSPIVIAVTIFTAMFLLAGVFGIDPSFSFWSNFERGEGGLQVIHLYLFFMLLVTLFREKREWKKILWLSIIAALLMIGYGIGSGLKYVDANLGENGELIGGGGIWYQTFSNFIGSSFKDEGYRFQGSIGNPAYVAAYLVFIIFYAMFLLFDERGSFKSWRSWRLLVLILIFSVFFYLAATRGAFLGAIAGTLAFIAYAGFSIKKLRKWAIVGVIAVVIATSALIGLRESPFIQSLPGARIFDISFSARTFGDRLIMWKIALEGWKERPLLGYGPENYIYVFDAHFEPEYFRPQEGFGAWFDRAHSVVFDYLVETGILGLLSYLFVFASAVISVVMYRIRHPNEFTGYRTPIIHALLFALPIAYLVQGLVLFDVLTIYVNWFLFLAFAVFMLESRETAHNKT